MRRRLLGTGPWPVHGLGDVFLLRGGRAQLAGGVAGTWRVLALGPASGGGAAMSVGAATGVPLEAVLVLALEGRAETELFVACWRLLRLLGAAPEQRLELSADFAWRRPASRCVPNASSLQPQCLSACSPMPPPCSLMCPPCSPMHPGEPLLPDVLGSDAPSHGRGPACVGPGAGGDA